MLNDFFTWYLAPWRRINRLQFGVILTLVTVPGLIMSFIGIGNMASGFLGPLTGALGAGQGLQNAVSSGNLGDIQQSLGAINQLLPTTAGHTVTQAPAGIPWGSLFNNLLLLAIVPLCRMRLRDMGWVGWKEIALTVIFNISVLNAVLENLFAVDLLPANTLFGMANFIGYAWLCFAKSKPREEIDFTKPIVSPRPENLTPTPKPYNEQDEPPRNPFI
jgi:hypothetical protein